MSIQTQSHKFAATILQNLPEVPENIMQGWIENPRALQKLLSGLIPPASATGFKIWKTIEVAGVKTNLVVIAVGFLGIVKKQHTSSSYQEICVRARELGLQLVPQELVEEVGRACKGCEPDYRAVIGMESINGVVNRVELVHGTPFIKTQPIYNTTWMDDAKFIFVLPSRQ